MSTWRAKFGNLGGGVFGLKTSLPSIDITTADVNDPYQTSFYSEWVDLAKVLALGTASSNSNLPTNYAVPDPGFIPWIEARRIDGTTIYDDRTPFTWGTGGGANSLDGLGIISTRGQIRLPGTPTGTPVPYTVLYLIYNLPVASQ
jgi:hypothetical protein